MYRKRLILTLSLGFVIAMSTGLFLGVLSSITASKESYIHTAQLIGAIYSQHPDLEQSLIQKLNQPKSDSEQIGSSIMNQYGYTERVFIEKNHWVPIANSLWVWGLLFVLFAAIQYVILSKKRLRIEGLTTYLHSINKKQESALPLKKEDELSFLEDEMYKTVVELRQTRETALKERQSLADNLADIAHQLKTPITSIFLMAELLSDSINGNEEIMYVEKIQKQMTRMEQLVSTLLTLSRLDAGTLEMQQNQVNISEILINAAEPVIQAIDQKSQTLIIQSEPTVIYRGDGYWCTEAIINLIKNCCEHTPVGGTMWISYEQNPIFTKIVVEDNGDGLVIEDIPHLFERFYKGRNAHKESVGIGLSLAKSIIEKQNGNIRAENRLEGGARFIIKIYTR